MLRLVTFSVWLSQGSSPFLLISSSPSSLLESWYHMPLPLLLQIFISCLFLIPSNLTILIMQTLSIGPCIFLIVVGRGDKYCSCVWTWVNAIVCVLLTAKPCFLLALLPTAVCNFPFFVPFKFLGKESIRKAVMGSRFLKFSAFVLFCYLAGRFFNFMRINTYPGLSVPCQRCSTHIFSFPTWIFLLCLTTAG